MQPSMEKLRHEVSLILRAAADPNLLTFKQVRIAVEKSLGIPEDSLDKERKSMIKKAVHSVMDELEAEGSDAEDDAGEDGGHTNGAKLARGKGGEDRSSREGKTSKELKRSNPKGATGAGGAKGGRDSKGRKRDRDDDDDDEDNEDEDEDEDLGEGVVCLLNRSKSTRKQVSVKVWKANVQVDIREYYLSKEGDYRPGRKGITLNPVQWAALKSARRTIDSMMKGLK